MSGVVRVTCAPPRESSALNADRRASELDRLAAGEMVDVLVVGGGITGVGVALDAASRGLSVALLERGDLAQGTSRWSSKLVHGGLRYLRRGEFGLAWVSALERAALLRNAAHLVRPLPFLVPLNERMRPREGMAVELGLRLGDWMRAAAHTSRRTLPPPRRVSAAEAIRLAPALETKRLRGALLYWDCQLVDDARLVVSVARTAARYGARILTYCSGIEPSAGRSPVRDELTGQTFAVKARSVVNATGVWAGELADVRLRPSRGSHVLVPSSLLGEPRAAVSVPVPDERGRWLFALPGDEGYVTIGVTDVPHEGPTSDAPAVSDREVEFLLDRLSQSLSVPLRADQVIGRYAGLRPLLASGSKATADLSRRHAVIDDQTSGLVTVVGGKLTTYRRMAQDVVDQIASADAGAGPCRTARLALVGGEPLGGRYSQSDLPQRLVRRYGAEAAAVAALGRDRPHLLAPVGDGLDALGCEFAFAVSHELALTPSDLVDRRTRLGLVRAARAGALESACTFLAGQVGA